MHPRPSGQAEEAVEGNDHHDNQGTATKDQTLR